MKNVKCMPVVTTCLMALMGMMSMSSLGAKSIENKFKNWIDEGADSLKKGVEALGDDFDAVQEYLDNYHWKGVIQEKATSGPVTLKHLELNGHHRAVIAKPGEQINAEVECELDADEGSVFDLYRILVGIKGAGPQAVIGNQFSLVSHEIKEQFTLTAPSEAGVYQIRFKPVAAVFKDSALDYWKDEHGNEPDGRTTIGIIIVK